MRSCALIILASSVLISRYKPSSSPRCVSRAYCGSFEEKRLLENVKYEVFPTTKNVDELISALPPFSIVSVTCSSGQGLSGLEATQSFCIKLIEQKHRVIPHLPARLINGPEHTSRLARWLRDNGIKHIFIIGGDVDTPVYYHSSLLFMEDLLKNDPGVEIVGFAVYPDGHPSIDPHKLFQAALEKQSLLKKFGVKGEATTQLCFDHEKVIHWLNEAKTLGFTTPVNIGLAGRVDCTRLISLGMKIGIGSSIKFLTKNSSIATTLFSVSKYDPTLIFSALAKDASALNIKGVHSFTFNAVGATADWVETHLKK